MSFKIIVTEELTEGGETIQMYGLVADWGERFESISAQKEIVRGMQNILNCPEMGRCHKRDILEDMVQQLYMD